jgi:hypothetical protein
MITQGSGTNPDTLKVAGCFDGPIAQLAEDALEDDATLTITSDSVLADVLDDDTRRLIMIDMTEYAHVESLSGGVIAIDTDPTTAGSQGLSRAYPDGTPICRVDVITYSIVTDGTTGIPGLVRDRNQGDGAETIAEGISNLQLTVPASRRVRAVFTGRSEHRNPVSGEFLTRSLDTDLALRN